MQVRGWLFKTNLMCQVFLLNLGKWPVAQYSTIPASVSASDFILGNWLCELGCPFSGLVAKKQESGHDLFLHLRDQEDRHVGLNYQTGNVDLQIPGSYYDDNRNGTSRIALIELPANASYTVDVDAAFSQLSLESYNLTVISIKPDKIGQFNVTATIPKSTVQHASVQNGTAQTHLSGTLDLDPNVLSPTSKGKYITGYVGLPADFNVSFIDPSSLRLNDAIPLVPGTRVTIGDHDSDGIPDLIVKFDRQIVKTLFTKPGNYTLHITGNYVRSGNTVPFEAFDSVYVR